MVPRSIVLALPWIVGSLLVASGASAGAPSGPSRPSKPGPTPKPSLLPLPTPPPPPPSSIHPPTPTPQPAPPPPKPAPAKAASEPAAATWTPLAAQSRVGLAYELWPTADGVAMTWGLGAQVQVRDHLFVDADFAFGFISADTFVGRFKQAAYGNPTAGVHYVDFLPQAANVSFHVGATLTIPLLADPSAEVAVGATVLAPTRALVDAYRFAPYSMPIRVAGGIELQANPNVYLRFDLVPTLFIPVKSGVDTAFFIDQISEIELRSDVGFGGGLRLQECFTLTENDLIQVAMEPFVAYQSKDPGLFARLGLLVALDKGLGFGFDRDKLATVRIAGGYHW